MNTKTDARARWCVGLIVTGMLAGSPSLAATQQEAAQLPAIALAHISPTLYFPSVSNELASRNALHVRVADLVKDFADADQSSLRSDLDAANQTLIALQRHLAYLKVQTLEDTRDSNAKAAESSVETDRSVLEAAISSRLRQVPAAQINSLGSFAFLARQAQQDASHALSPDAARYRGLVIGKSEDDLADAYSRLIESLGRPKAIASTDRAARQAAIEGRNAAYDKAAPVTAGLLAEIIDLENKDAAAQGYANAAERKYDLLDLSPQLIQQTLTDMQAQAPVHRHYEQVLAEHAAQKLDLPSVASWEISGVSAAPAISLDQARKLILDALELLGQDYVRRFGQLLDSRNGRLDLAGGAHRAHTGTSIAAYDAPVAFYYEGYRGTLESVSVIAHEGGHAIHREWMNASGIPVYERTGPHYLFEGFAMFNELLVLDHATDVATTPQEHTHALESFLENLSDALFVTSEETAFERSLYTEASAHQLLDRAQVDSIYQASIAPYEYWPMSDVGASYYWMRKSLVFQDPLYEVNYLYAGLVAVALYERAHSDPEFASKYEALLSRGFDADPQTLLASINIQLDDPELVRAASRLFQEKTKELENLYQKEPVSAK